MQIAIPCEYVRKSSQQYLVGSEAKNPLPAGEKMDCDWAGLSCLVMDESLDDYA
jgi:hypothetical protein